MDPEKEKFNRQMMVTSKMSDDSGILKSVKTKQYQTMQQTYMGRPFITQNQFLSSEMTPALRLRENASPEERMKQRELLDFETRFQYSTKYAKDFEHSKYRDLKKELYIPYP